MRKIKRRKNTLSKKQISIFPETREINQPNISNILEQFHKNTNENKDLPFYEWISYKHHLPLDNNEQILIYDPIWNSLDVTKSYIALQHALYDSYTKTRIISGYWWMRIKNPTKKINKRKIRRRSKNGN